MLAAGATPADPAFRPVPRGGGLFPCPAGRGATRGRRVPSGSPGRWSLSGPRVRPVAPGGGLFPGPASVRFPGAVVSFRAPPAAGRPAGAAFRPVPPGGGPLPGPRGARSADPFWEAAGGRRSAVGWSRSLTTCAGSEARFSGAPCAGEGAGGEVAGPVGSERLRQLPAPGAVAQSPFDVIDRPAIGRLIHTHQEGQRGKRDTGPAGYWSGWSRSPAPLGERGSRRPSSCGSARRR
jgi:hypothetical protein